MQHSQRRKEFKWTSHYNKEGVKLLNSRVRTLDQLSNDHIINI